MRTDNNMLALEATATFEDLPAPDVIVVPGGVGTRDLLDDERSLDWLRGAHATSTWTTSVCTGSLLLGAAGILEGLRATSHWLELETLERFGATPTGERVVAQGKVVTSAGVSSGIDMALLARRRDRRRRVRAGRAADDRVRPPAPVRRRVDRQGRARADGEAARGRRGVPLGGALGPLGGQQVDAAARRVDPLHAHAHGVAEAQRAPVPCADEDRALLVELPPLARQPPDRQEALERAGAVLLLAERDERATADDAGDLAVELRRPPALLEQAALEQERAHDVVGLALDLHRLTLAGARPLAVVGQVAALRRVVVHADARQGARGARSGPDSGGSAT